MVTKLNSAKILSGTNLKATWYSGIDIQENTKIRLKVTPYNENKEFDSFESDIYELKNANLNNLIVQNKTGGSVTDYSGKYYSGDTIEISATPKDRYEFIEWQITDNSFITEGSKDSKEIILTMPETGDINLTSFFKANKEDGVGLNLDLNNDESGTISGEGFYLPGDTIEIQATAAPGYHFVNWTDAETEISTEAEYSYIMPDSEKTLTANFEMNEKYNLIVTFEGSNSDLNDIVEQVPHGKIVTLKIEPEIGYKLDRWETTADSATFSEEYSSETSYTMTAEDTTITGIIKPDFAGGSGTETDPYLISNANELNNIRYFLKSNFKQIADIDLSGYDHDNDGKGWLPIGTDEEPFTGCFDGDQFKISNLTINRKYKSAVGLFSFADNAQILNTFLTDINIKAYQNTGGIAGYVYQYYGSIKNSYSLDNIIKMEPIDDIYVGGLVGTNCGKIEKCYSNSEIDWDSIDRAGALVGKLEGDLKYSIWDNQKSNLNEAWGKNFANIVSGVLSKTTEEMKNKTTYDSSGELAENGWDFDTIWDIDGATNNGYPFLR
ncbi:MAG: InlB B-repeat-containing protein [Candidatus Muiribacteriota bacterium]